MKQLKSFVFQFHKVRLKEEQGKRLYGDNMFQFHKVRLKETTMDGVGKFFDMFQFHKVRLKA